MRMTVNDVVQFTENHKWCGCFGVITEDKREGDCKTVHDRRADPAAGNGIHLR